MQSANHALERLIQQFSQPMAFIRELVQNSLDADTTTVELETGWDRSARCIYLSVSDNGCGMTEEIIDNRLTQLFSSTKEDDLTKIGKFGIGFVSIFAINPELVVLETGCEGESWRVLFKPDRSFEKRLLRERVEGTSIKLFVKEPKQKLESFSLEAKETISYWCRYSETEILFNGLPINRPFSFEDQAYQYRLKDGNTEAVLFPCEEKQGHQGYYNRGLTLLEGPGSPIPHIAFKVRSPYLEHTLSRDNILQDEHYEIVLKRLKEAAREEMPSDLFTKLAATPEKALWKAAGCLFKCPEALEKEKVIDIEILPVKDGKISLSQLDETVYYHPELNEFYDAVAELGTLPIHISFQGELGFLLNIGISPIRIKEDFWHYRLAEPSEAEENLLRALLAAAKHLSCCFVEILHSPLSVPGVKLAHYLNPAKKARQKDEVGMKKGDQIALARAHPLIAQILKLLPTQPALATSLLVRKIHLDLGLSDKAEASLFGKQLKRMKEKAQT